MIKLEWIKEKVRKSEYYFTQHGDAERQEDGLSIKEVEESILNGSVLEKYEDTGRGESCLLVGFTEEGKPVHVVCGIRGDRPVIITVYIPLPPKFKTPYERG